MDALSSSNPGGFQQMVSHISLFHENMSAGFLKFCKKILQEDIKLRGVDTGKYILWNVPGMASQLGKTMPFDIYGHHVLCDEKELYVVEKKITHGVFRYAVASAGVRRREGGRRAYDYITQNFVLACGAVLGSAFLYHSRRRFNYLQRRPALSIFLSLVICAATVPVVRSLFKIFAVGITIAERQHAKALQTAQCYDCLGDVYEFTEDQVADVKLARLPPPKPGMPPVTPEQEKAFATAMEMQSLVLGRDLNTIRSLMKGMLQKEGLLISQPAIDEGKGEKHQQHHDDQQQQHHKATKKEMMKELRLTEKEETQFLTRARSVPAGMLCDVHLGLRTNPEGYRHPELFPIFPRDRVVAALRPPVLKDFDSNGEQK